ncbi:MULTISPECIES: hypothetical protein [Acinetobacter]|uniref:Uncharacterized protein n=1 Tax=Acinetobacter higginsii TaxID=70347 RepID=N9SXT6_9GAMM|nr:MULTISPECIES: hypothetical protein [Acinetobacter]ENX55960.1 hypothetical protein F902_03055 [Acinetobacter higginsii]ENX63358.1 hypothetical protein F885_00860 [Acinetobacter higginsii]MCH7317634.1 hypothetical protein [Acinetobacter higginsii]MCI3881148.1 hypothetical protein [Acinetobacter higginsii]
MNKLILKIFLISSFLFTSSCRDSETTEKGIYFNKVIDNYFGEYGPREKVWVNKPVNKYATAEVEKSKMSFGDFEIIQKKLQDDGWVLISSHDSFFEYCFDKKIYMGVLYPINAKHYGYDGEEIKYENINEWSVGLSYSEAGVKHCIKDEIPVIKLD